MKPLSLDLKERIVAAHQAHPELTQQTLAQRFLTAQSTVSMMYPSVKTKNHETLCNRLA